MTGDHLLFTAFLAGLLLLIGLAWLIAAPRFVMDRGTSYEHSLSRGWGFIPLVLAVVVLAFGCSTIIQAKNVGVLTTFGKPSERTLDPGLHLKLPWQKVTELDGTIQTDEYRGDDCIYVRIGDGSRSCVTLTNRWRINPDEANVIYGDFRSDDPTASFRSAVVSTQLKAAVQEVMAGYNPIATLEVVEGSNAQSASELNFAPDYDQVSADVTASMKARLAEAGELATISSITVSYVSLSDSTQATLDNFIEAVGDTRIAAQKRSTAAEEAEANKVLQESVSNNPGVLQSKCLDSLNAAIEAGYQLPAGFNCLGSGSAVVVPSSK